MAEAGLNQTCKHQSAEEAALRTRGVEFGDAVSRMSAAVEQNTVFAMTKLSRGAVMIQLARDMHRAV
jgi:hypothetical protein